MADRLLTGVLFLALLAVGAFVVSIADGVVGGPWSSRMAADAPSAAVDGPDHVGSTPAATERAPGPANDGAGRGAQGDAATAATGPAAGTAAAGAAPGDGTGAGGGAPARDAGGGAAARSPDPDVAPADRIRVEVLNGDGRPGLARAGTDRLRAAGFDVVYFGNARAFGRDSTLVLRRAGDEAAAHAVARALGAGQVESRLDPDLHLEVTVVLGADWPPAAAESPPGPAGWLRRLVERIRG